MMPEQRDQFFLCMAQAAASQAAATEALARAFATMYGEPTAVSTPATTVETDAAATKRAERAVAKREAAEAAEADKIAKAEADKIAKAEADKIAKAEADKIAKAGAEADKIAKAAPAAKAAPVEGDVPTLEEMRTAVLWVGANAGGRAAVTKLLTEHGDGHLQAPLVPEHLRAGVIAACAALGYPPF